MKVSKTLLNTIMVAVTVGTISSCTKSVESKAKKQTEAKGDKTATTPVSCPACGMG